MRQKINVTGSTVIDAGLELEDDAVLVVVGQCSRDGAVLQQSAGRVEVRGIKMNDAILLTGAEAAEWRQRIADENNDADEHVINGNGGDEPADG
jgi:hypothetical protein